MEVNIKLQEIKRKLGELKKWDQENEKSEVVFCLTETDYMKLIEVLENLTEITKEISLKISGHGKN